jgi:hypothetical protein
VNPHRWTRLGLLALTSGVAAVTFAVSFHGLRGYGADVMRLGGLSPLVPVGVDLASLVALLAAHMRTGERWTRRAYAWTVFATTAGLSVAGNLADGFARELASAGLAGVAMAPVVFVLVSHLAITSWRSSTSTGIPAEASVPAAEVPAEVAIEQSESKRSARTVPAAPRRSFADTRRAAAALAADGADVAEVARILGVTSRQARAALKPVPIES